MKILRNFFTKVWFNLDIIVFHGQILEIKYFKKIQIQILFVLQKSRIRIQIFGIRRKRFESESESEYSLQHCFFSRLVFFSNTISKQPMLSLCLAQTSKCKVHVGLGHSTQSFYYLLSSIIQLFEAFRENTMIVHNTNFHFPHCNHQLRYSVSSFLFQYRKHNL